MLSRTLFILLELQLGNLLTLYPLYARIFVRYIAIAFIFSELRRLTVWTLLLNRHILPFFLFFLEIFKSCQHFQFLSAFYCKNVLTAAQSTTVKGSDKRHWVAHFHICTNEYDFFSFKKRDRKNIFSL